MKERLSNPPVYYTIAQAQFSPVAAMANYINAIQDKLRFDGYTLFEQQKITQLHFEPSAPSTATVVEVPLWRFTHSDRKSGFILSQTHLVYHTTHYQTHTQFFDAFLMGLEQIHSIVTLDHLSRLGLRYLNAVLPSAGEVVNQYLINEVHGVPTTATPRYTLCESVFDTKIKSCSSSGTLVNRVFCKLGPLGYSPDIPPHDLLPMPKFAKNEPLSHAVIDIDHFIQEQMPINFQQTKIQLASLHIGIKEAFNANTTEYAKKAWV